MTLTDGAKNFLAQYAGVGNCFAASGVPFKDLEGVSHTGGTSAVAAMLYTAQEVAIAHEDKVPPDLPAAAAVRSTSIVGTKSYNDFYSANGDTKISLGDVATVAGLESPPTQYCIVAPTEALWQILQATDSITGANIFVSKVHVDGFYIGHYSPEELTFCTGCKCDTVVDCGFGSHTVTVKATGYNDWTQTRTLVAGDVFSDTPVMVPLVAPTPTPTPTPTPVPLAENLLENPNFEEGMKGWTVDSTGPEDTPKIVSDVKYEGNYSMFFMADSTKQARVKPDFMPVTPGRRLRISGYFKGENVTTDPAIYWHRFMWVGSWFDSAKKDMWDPAIPIHHFDLLPPLGTYDWIKKEATEEVPAGAAYYGVLRVGFRDTGTGKCWADKLEVVMLPLKITFQSIPIGAEIIIDGKTTNRFTPETIELEEDTYIIELRKVGYVDFTQSITVTADETFSFTLTRAPTPTPVPPIEIEVERARLAGSVDIGKSTIPRRLKTTRKATFRMHAANTGDLPAKYRVTLEFRGYRTFPFVSEWSDPVEPGNYKSIYIDVVMPDAAVPVGETVAFYDLYSILEAEEVVVVMPPTMSISAVSGIPLWFWDEDGIVPLPAIRKNAVKYGMGFGIAVSEGGEDNRTTIVAPHVDTPEERVIPFSITLSHIDTPVAYRGYYEGTVVVNGGAGTLLVNLTKHP